METIVFRISQGWKRWAHTNDLPLSATIYMEGKQIFRQHHKVHVVAAFHRKMNTGAQWIIVTDDGWYYKSRALYVIWHENYSRTRWSDRSLVKAIEAITSGQEVPDDPDYET